MVWKSGDKSLADYETKNVSNPPCHNFVNPQNILNYKVKEHTNSSCQMDKFLPYFAMPNLYNYFVKT